MTFILISGFTLNRKILRFCSAFLNVPALIMTIIPVMWANFEDQLYPVESKKIFTYLGFLVSNKYWLECLFMYVCLFMNIIFIR